MQLADHRSLQGVWRSGEEGRVWPCSERAESRLLTVERTESKLLTLERTESRLLTVERPNQGC